MQIRNNTNNAVLTISKEKWDALGKKKLNFSVINESDDNLNDQVVESLVKKPVVKAPDNGEAKVIYKEKEKPKLPKKD